MGPSQCRGGVYSCSCFGRTVGASELNLFQRILGVQLIELVVLLANVACCTFAILSEWSLDDSIRRLFFMNIGLVFLTPIFFKDQAMLFVYGTALFPILYLFMGLTVPNGGFERVGASVILGGLNLLLILLFAAFTKGSRFIDGLLFSLIPSFFIGFFTIGLPWYW